MAQAGPGRNHLVAAGATVDGRFRPDPDSARTPIGSRRCWSVRSRSRPTDLDGMVDLRQLGRIGRRKTGAHQGAPDPFTKCSIRGGAPPPALDLQRRLIEAFDPQRVINPGRLPGRDLT